MHLSLCGGHRSLTSCVCDLSLVYCTAGLFCSAKQLLALDVGLFTYNSISTLFIQLTKFHNLRSAMVSLSGGAAQFNIQ